MNFKPEGLATGIGSVPHTDPDEAVKFIMSYFPEAPNWPQIPARGKQEGFINQFTRPLIELGIVVEKNEKQYFDTQQAQWGEKLARFYELYLAAMDGDSQALEFFKFPESAASGYYAFTRYLEENGTGSARYLKGQISGPLTLGLAMTDQDRRAIYYNPQARDVLIKTLALQGLNQVKVLARFGLPVLLFVDDPGLYALGQSMYITLKREEIIAELNSIYEAVQTVGALAGTHSCSGMDWSLLFESKVDIISFDAFEYFSTIASYMDEMKGFMARGGSLAWGIVPTSAESVFELTVDSLKSLWEERVHYLVEKGIDRQLIFDQAIITPACGTGTVSIDTAIRIHELTGALSGIISSKVAALLK
ncbi:hypothetical protein [Phosphitispora sp. TUW77]|uniref:hypothetical protein n=1 Tax=Phosphitispora sp. TUW77 TaxID=3152361 RepID=UPI003AB90B20